MYYHEFYDVETFKPKSIRFDVWSAHEIKKLSVAKIHSIVPFDGLGYPINGGLYDARLGPLQFNSDPCATCGHNLKKCVGHYGHIQLPLPVLNPLFTGIVTSMLTSCCLNCHKMMLPEAEKSVYVAQLKLIDAGYLIEAHQLDTYLEENLHKQHSQIHDEMVAFCRATISNPSVNLCKFADEKWRYYVKKLLHQGNCKKICIHCNKKVIKVKHARGRLYIQGAENTYLMPSTIRDHLRSIWENEKTLLQTMFKVLARSEEQYPTDICFTDCVLVTPPNTRPLNVVNQKRLEHPKSAIYRHVLLACDQIRCIVQVMNKDESKEDVSKEIQSLVNAFKGETMNEKLHNGWNALQVSVNSILDANAAKALVSTSVGVPKIGLRQLIEKKSGILRMNMMGKRVDFFARSVVTPDPMLNINEIGVPEVFAKKLTFPTPVTSWNVTELNRAVLNGPQKYPGANIVEDDGSVVWISGTAEKGRKSLGNTLLTPKLDSKSQKVVHRHLRDGDMLLINRQPSLHKPSIMAHKARVLRGEKTFRLHYANCKAYNADFDGDEVNAHFPQSELARAEASEIVNAAYQYLVPRDGTPLSGLIQDHVIAGFRLSLRDKVLDRREYNQHVFQAIGFLVDDIKTLPPAILKPKTLWTGKQVISTVIINLTPTGEIPLNMHSKTKLGYGAWPTVGKKCSYMTVEERVYMSETNVVVRRGELLCGVLDKNHVGSTQYGLVHNFYELYGGEYSANLLSAFSKLFTYYQQKEGFTLGVQDILVQERANIKRNQLAAKISAAGVDAAKRALDIPSEQDIDEEMLQKSLEIAYKKNTNFRGLIDSEYKSTLDQFTNEINKACLPLGLLQQFPANNLQLMVQSGAKGSTVNTMQISCSLGQIELEGKRPPLMISGKSLPSFKSYDPSPIAGGFIVSRFMTGIRPQEFFFHCMAGREGLIDTAVKTSRSGYLQRCLVKHLEGLVVNYDLTVRDLSDNSVVQFLYGEDGLDILKSQLLKPAPMKFFLENIRAFVNKREVKALQQRTDRTLLEERKKRVTKYMSSSRKTRRDSAFLKFCRQVAHDPPPVMTAKEMDGRTKEATNLCHLWQTVVDDDTKKRHARHLRKTVDPVVADFKPDTNFGAVSEIVENMIDEFIDKNKETLSLSESESGNTLQKFRNAVYLKTFKSLCQPGEAVGVLAAQSVGEPSTQMTLNTFHFAGRGEMNVTLGIPRLREILMVASKRIKTPTTEIPFKTDVPDLEEKAEFLRKSLTKVVLKDLLEKVTVKESLRLKGQHVRLYELNLRYLPRRGYSNFTNLKPRQILKYVGKEFLAKLHAMLKKNAKSSYRGNLILDQRMSTRRKKQTTDEDVDEKNETSANQPTDEDVNEKNETSQRVGDSDDDDDSDVDGDGDASEARRRGRRSDAMEYDDENEDDDDDKTSKSADNSDEEVDDDKVTNPDQSKNVENSDNDSSDSSEDDENTIDLKQIFNSSSALGSTPRKKRAQKAENYGIEKVEHDKEKKMWSKIVLWISLSYKRIDLSNLLPALLESAVVYEKVGIKRAITYVNSDGLLTLKTEGSHGVKEFFKHDRLLDLNKIYSNDIHAVARTYGIEAANRVINKEVQEVFKVYGITVDPRHLLLIADYMTFDGTYQPLNRSGMDNCPSPLQQMTFESTLKYLKNATIRNLQDNLQSPSSSLMVGQESKIGSGLCAVYNVTV